MNPFWENVLSAMAVGATLGFLIGFVKIIRRWRIQSPKTHEKPDKQKMRATFFDSAIHFFSQAIYILLGIALVWIGYFTIIGIADPTQTEYAANCATLIVSLATIFSIMIAFYEFSNRKNPASQEKQKDSSSPPNSPPS